MAILVTREGARQIDLKGFPGLIIVAEAEADDSDESPGGRNIAIRSAEAERGGGVRSRSRVD
jgi:hypothetical protein